MAMGKLSWVKLLPLVNRSNPPYITGSSAKDDLTLKARCPQAVGGGNFLLELLETLLLTGGPPPGGSFLD